MKGTQDALRRRFKKEPPFWIDAATPPATSTAPTIGAAVKALTPKVSVKRPSFILSSLINPGEVTVIRIPVLDGGRCELALLVDYVVRSLENLRTRRPSNSTPVLVVIDEVSDLFTGDERFVKTATDSLNKAIRRGRSLKIGYCLAAQNADGIPKDIINNLGTHILGRHQNIRGVTDACGAIFDKKMLQSLSSLQPGEFLVSLHGSRAPAYCNMQLSPYELYTI